MVSELRIEHQHSSAADVVIASIGAKAFAHPGELEVDELLYQAKAGGRNRCAFAHDDADGVYLLQS